VFAFYHRISVVASTDTEINTYVRSCNTESADSTRAVCNIDFFVRLRFQAFQDFSCAHGNGSSRRLRAVDVEGSRDIVLYTLHRGAFRYVGLKPNRQATEPQIPELLVPCACPAVIEGHLLKCTHTHMSHTHTADTCSTPIIAAMRPKTVTI